eukprot:GHVU01232037.1.p1 GENE.GHVU01232037.1~~GHVU01232037.1.p1  ORF type:complete len:302 (-),score=19.95 GHVU01232037.1:66-971(-)
MCIFVSVARCTQPTDRPTDRATTDDGPRLRLLDAAAPRLPQSVARVGGDPPSALGVVLQEPRQHRRCASTCAHAVPVRAYMCVRVRIHTRVLSRRMHTHVAVRANARVCVCVYAYVYVCACVCICAFVCVCAPSLTRLAGASIPHPHSQVIGMPIVPSQQLKLLGATQRYFNEHKSCLLCDYAKYERSSGLRVVDERDNYIAVIPFAASIPYHTKIIPLSHNAHFSEATDQDLAGAAEMLSTVCSRLACLMKNADFNVVLRTAPVPGGALSSQTADDYHWHIEFYPRLDSWPVAGTRRLSP